MLLFSIRDWLINIIILIKAVGANLAKPLSFKGSLLTLSVNVAFKRFIYRHGPFVSWRGFCSNSPSILLFLLSTTISFRFYICTHIVRRWFIMGDSLNFQHLILLPQLIHNSKMDFFFFFLELNYLTSFIWY